MGKLGIKNEKRNCMEKLIEFVRKGISSYF
jgi:hypothetical protein